MFPPVYTGSTITVDIMYAELIQPEAQITIVDLPGVMDFDGNEVYVPAGGVVVNANYPPEVSSVTYSHENENITIEFSEALQGFDGSTTVDLRLYVENLGFDADYTANISDVLSGDGRTLTAEIEGF